MTKDYPKYIAEIIPADLTDEMSANRQETLTDFGIAVMNGTKQALTDTQASQAVVAWDDTTTANVVYLKYLSGKIEKINQSDGTILTAQSGVWADRATLTYTEGGV